MLKHLNRDVETMVRFSRRRMELAGYDVPLVNATAASSVPAGMLLSTGEPFVVCYWDTPRSRVFDLIASDAGLHVGSVAREFGGHGTRRLGQFKVAREHPLAMI